MERYLKGLKDIENKYRFDEVNCYEHPLAIAYNYIRRGSDSLYLMYRKLYDSFCINTDHSDLSNFEEELGIRCEKKSVNGDLIESIKCLLDKGVTVIVPGNLKGLYYSRYYKKEDWGHLFLVRGYSDKKEVLIMMDNLHLPNLDKANPYVDFPIRYDDMIDLFNTYNEPESKYIFYLVKTNRFKTTKEIFVGFLQLYYKQFIEKIYMEKECVELYKREIKKNVNEKEITIKFKNAMLNIPKYKSITLELLIINMDKYGYDTRALCEIRDKLSKLWMRDNLMFLKSFLKNITEESTFNEDRETGLYQEKLMKEILKSIEFLSEIENTIDDSPYILCENNEDKLISYIDDKYIFDFNTGETYNTWLEDRCPKVIILNNFENINEFSFQVECSVTEDHELFGHEHGIFIRTNNDMYTFGLDSDYNYVLNNIGKYNIETYENSELNRSAVLCINKRKNNIEVGYIRDNKAFTLGEVRIEEKIIDLGIFCKTWEECDEIKIEFYDVKYNLT